MAEYTIADPNRVFDEDFIDQSPNPYIFGEDGRLIQYTDPNQNPETFADLRNQMGYDHIFALNALNERLKMRAAGDPVGFSPYELKKTGRSESEFGKFKKYVDRLESLYNQGYSISDINALGAGQDVTPSFSGTETVAPDTTATTTSSGVTYDQVSDFYKSLLGRDPGADNPNVQNWVNSGLSLSDIESQIAGSPEGQAYAASQTTSSSDGSTTTTTSNAGTTSDTSGSGAVADYSDQIAQYYQDLFGRGPQPAGAEYWQGQLASGAISPENLRQALISGAQGMDRTYYEASQSGGPVYDAFQELFGRAPARGVYNPETGQFEGGYGRYRSRLDAGEITPEEFRRNIVKDAYNRGEGGGRSADYQAYLNTLGIDRENSPFAIEGGGFANVPYGGDLSAYQAAAAGSGNQTQTGTPQFPFLGGKYGGMGGTGKGGGYTPGGQYQAGGAGAGGTPPATGGGYGGIMPQQYITGNQLYSGLPYGFTTPYGMAGQYMPSRGLMSGFSTGYGPYGGYQRPRYGGGKGGYGGGYGGGKGGGYGVPMYQQPRMMPYGGGYNPYAEAGGIMGPDYIR